MTARDNDDAGSPSGLCNTAMQLGTTLDLAMASFVFFNHAPASSHGTTVTGAFVGGPICCGSLACLARARLRSLAMKSRSQPG